MDDELPLPDLAELGLPDELPPMRLPDPAALARQARTSTLLARTREVAAASASLGCSTKEFELLWALAEELDFVWMTDDEARPSDGLDDWPDGSDEAVVEIWDLAFDFVVNESMWFDGDLDPESAPDLVPAGTVLMFNLLLAGGTGSTRGELSALIEDKKVDDPTPALLRRLHELGAVEMDGDVVKLTSLALWGMRERYVALGVRIAVLPPVEQMTAAELLSAALGLGEEAFATEARAWLALRSSEQAWDQLLGAATTGDATERVFAVHLITSNELGTEARWRSALDVPELRPYAKTELAGMEPDLTDSAWLLTDLLAATRDVEEGIPPTTPHEMARQMFEVMWRLPHPEASEVLEMIAEEHPVKQIAKAAGKAAFKARS